MYTVQLDISTILGRGDTRNHATVDYRDSITMTSALTFLIYAIFSLEYFLE